MGAQNKHPSSRMQISDSKILHYISIILQIEAELYIPTNLYVILKLNCLQMRISYTNTYLLHGAGYFLSS